MAVEHEESEPITHNFRNKTVRTKIVKNKTKKKKKKICMNKKKGKENDRNDGMKAPLWEQKNVKNPADQLHMNDVTRSLKLTNELSHGRVSCGNRNRGL